MCVKIYSKSRQIHEHLTQKANTHGILTKTLKIHEHLHNITKSVQKTHPDPSVLSADAGIYICVYIYIYI